MRKLAKVSVCSDGPNSVDQDAASEQDVKTVLFRPSLDKEADSRRLYFQNKTLAPSPVAVPKRSAAHVVGMDNSCSRAGEGIRTLDPNLGKVAVKQLLEISGHGSALLTF